MVFAFDVLVTGFSMPIFLYAGRNAESILPFQDATERVDNLPGGLPCLPAADEDTRKKQGLPPKGNPCHYIIMYARNQSISSSAS